MTFQLVDMLLPVLPMEDMLIIAMRRLLPATDMDMPLPTHRFIYNTSNPNTIKCNTLEIKKVETINTGYEVDQRPPP